MNACNGWGLTANFAAFRSQSLFDGLGTTKSFDSQGTAVDKSFMSAQRKIQTGYWVQAASRISGAATGKRILGESPKSPTRRMRPEIASG
ncbi:MAG: hypothetical protein CMM01_16590 [Rhodopirellula sp.]|nr:hypothetical protein [Rhodopirellula sp.]MAI72506.1 hypothetical protein [Rhodopirellula sp.]OUX50282.1 MAG: hypothetical protein CBE43_07620 [Rhodopirellula sp. TMED283]